MAEADLVLSNRILLWLVVDENFKACRNICASQNKFFTISIYLMDEACLDVPKTKATIVTHTGLSL